MIYEPSEVLRGVSWEGGLPAKLEREGDFVKFGPVYFGMLNPLEGLAWKFFGRIPKRFNKFKDYELYAVA
jgi:hypothetical protein